MEGKGFKLGGVNVIVRASEAERPRAPPGLKCDFSGSKFEDSTCKSSRVRSGLPENV